MKPTQIWTALLLIALATPALAQHETGNGGDPNELAEFDGMGGEHLESWYSVKQDLIHGFDLGRNQELDLGKINPQGFKDGVLKTLRTVRVEFDDQEITINDVPRPCENYTDASAQKRIHCNTKNYVAAMQNYTSETQYKMIAHEYFSAAGFEPNRYGISDYFVPHIDYGTEKGSVTGTLPPLVN